MNHETIEVMLQGQQALVNLWKNCRGKITEDTMKWLPLAEQWTGTTDSTEAAAFAAFIAGFATGLRAADIYREGKETDAGKEV